MLSSIRQRSSALRRMFALLLLASLVYAGFVRVRAIVHADACVQAGGSYDANADACRPGR